MKIFKQGFTLAEILNTLSINKFKDFPELILKAIPSGGGGKHLFYLSNR